MRLLKRDHSEDVDVESCLENIHRLEGMGWPELVVDLRTTGDRTEVDLTRHDEPAVDQDVRHVPRHRRR